MITFEDYQEVMRPFFKDYDAFLNRPLEICYIPENAESLDEAFTYLDLEYEVETFIESNPEYLIEHEITAEDLLNSMFEILSWEIPSTYLEQLIY